MSKIRKKLTIAISALLCASVCSVGIFHYAGQGRQADAYNSTDAKAPSSNELGEITLLSYETRQDGLVFDGNKLNQLFGKLVQGVTGTPTASADITAATSRVTTSTSSVDGTASTGNTLTQSKALDFKTMQTQLGSPITLQFGGYDWTVVYATTNTTADDNTSAGDLIVTLWMNDNITTSKWSAATPSTDTSENYPTNMYSSSQIRVEALNAGGDDGQRAGNSATDGTTYYSTSISSRASSISLNDRKSNDFAKFTLSNSVLGKGSLVDFLTMPKSVEYQRAENWVWSYSGTGGPFLLPNEAWGKDANGPDTAITWNGMGGWYPGGIYGPSNMSLIPQKPAYYEWVEDYLWLPSLTETGYYTSGSSYCVSLWGIPVNDNIVKSTLPSGTTRDVSWLRSGTDVIATTSRSITSAGAIVDATVSEVGGVRPALHLNLSKAFESAAMELEAPPAEVSREYNGENQLLTEESWYRSEIFDNSSLCAVSYVDAKTSLITIPRDAGEYRVTFTLRGDKYSWKGDASSKTRVVTYKITPKILQVNFQVDQTTQVPTLSLVDQPYASDNASLGDFALLIHYYSTTGEDLGTDPSKLKKGVQYQAKAEFGGRRGFNYTPSDTSPLSFVNPATRVTAKWDAASKQYNGQEQTFILLVGCDEYTAELISSGAQQTAADEFTATNAGTYTVKLSFTNKEDYIWDKSGTSADITLDFEITRLTKIVNILGFNPADGAVTFGYDMKATILYPDVYEPITLQIGAYSDGRLIENLCGIGLTTSSNTSEFTLLTSSSRLSTKTYELGLSSSDEAAQNYSFQFNKPYTITIKEPSASGGINWLLKGDGSLAGYKSDPADTNSTTFDTKIYYDGRSYAFELDASAMGYAVKTDYNEDGFINGYKTTKKGGNMSLGAVSNAGEYVTYVRVSKSGESNTTYSISWKIEKARFDLSNVRWIQNGKISYREGVIHIELASDTIPAGLIPHYGGATQANKAGQSGTVSVTFTVEDSENYAVPSKLDKNSYIFNASGDLADFEWDKDWEIMPVVIPVVWTYGTVSFGNKKVNAAVLAGGYDTYLTYVYYEADSHGNKLDPNAEPLTEIEVIEGTVKYYIAEVSVKAIFAEGYKLEDKLSYLSPVFEVGNVLIAVQLSAIKTSYIYWANSVNFLFEVTQGAIDKSAFNLTYYQGLTRLVNPPKDVGSYSVQITLKDKYLKEYSIDGENLFDFTIERATIQQNWDMGTKPPILKVNAAEKACISYEYCDAVGNPVSFAMIQASPGTYSIRAVIKSSAQRNYTFKNALNDDTIYSEWVSFTVNAGDTIINPDNATPSNPSVDPNDPNSGVGSSGKILVTLTLLTASAEYNGNTQAAQFANSLGLPESAFIITYMQDGVPVTSVSAAGIYQILVTLAPAYADMYEISGVSSFVFVITGGSGTNPTNPPGGIGDNPSDNTVEGLLPVILSGVSLVLIIVFGFMAFNNALAANNAKKKARELASVSYSVSYSVAPASLLLLFGLSQSNWWIIAGVLMGVALIMAVVMFMFRKKKLAALEIVQVEQARIAEEKQYADQQRRDDQMRMMFSALQQNQQPQQQAALDYNSIQMMIASTVSALLPSAQTMQALPPARDPDEYHAQMQAQQERLEAQIAAQQAQIAAQQEQMAQQQAMFNQMIQEQQAAQSAAYASYEEEQHDEALWLDETDSIISLEESYGLLSEEAKRYYYETGSHIMNKPGTKQNDGRYVVLFKYRGKTLFKLCIKDSAPVLVYLAADGKGKEAIRIDNPAALDTAKSIIDRQIAGIDQQVG